MIDKNGKLFGKVNIIDLLIILVIVAAIAFVGKRFFAGNDNDYGTPERVRLTFYADEAPALLSGKAEAGEPVTDYDNSTSLGTLSSYESEDAYTYTYDATAGEAVKVPVPNVCFLTFSCETEGYVAADGLRINGFQYCIGGSHTICVGRARVNCRLANFEVIG